MSRYRIESCLKTGFSRRLQAFAQSRRERLHASLQDEAGETNADNACGIMWARQTERSIRKQSPLSQEIFAHVSWTLMSATSLKAIALFKEVSAERFNEPGTAEDVHPQCLKDRQ